MADLRAVLTQLLQRGDPEAAAYLNDPSTQPGANAPRGGLFGRGRGRPTAPLQMPPQWALDMPARPPMQPGPEMPPYPMGPGALPVEASAPPLHVRPLAPDNPGAYGNFADYANAQNRPRRILPRAIDATPPMSPPGFQRGLEPPTASGAQSAAGIENAAWNAALARVRGQMQAEQREENRWIPRPGRPLMAQAWARPIREPRTGRR